MKRKIVHCLYVATLAATMFPMAARGGENLKLKPVATEVLDAKGVNLKYPEGIACSKKSAVVVADSGNGRLLRYSLQNETLQPGPEIKLSQVPYPTKVRINSREEIFVLDGKQRRIARITPEGSFAGFVEPAEGLMPKSFAIDGADFLYILDVRAGRVVVADPAGKKASEIPFPAGYGFMSDIAVDTKGNILLLDSVKMTVYRAARDAKAFQPLTGSLREYLEFATDLTTDPQGRILVTDQNGGAIIILGPDGAFQGRQLTSGRKNGLVYFPAQACVTEGGEFLVADRNNSRIQLFRIMK